MSFYEWLMFIKEINRIKEIELKRKEFFKDYLQIYNLRGYKCSIHFIGDKEILRYYNRF